MNRDQLAAELDARISALMQEPAAAATSDPLLQIAAESRLLPSDEFKSGLQDALAERASVAALEAYLPLEDGYTAPAAAPDFVPSFSTRQFALLPADPRSLLLSFLSHAAAVALIASGIWIGTGGLTEKPQPLGEVSRLILPPGEGGGSGGDRSPTQASRGTPPKFDSEQLAPPVIVVPNDRARLQVDPTVLGPLDVNLPQPDQIGDLVSTNIVVPSNGTGGPAGIGDGPGTGIGPGKGPGVGAGSNGGYGGGLYVPGKGGVSAPRAIYDPEPEYSEEARRVKFQGNVVLSLIVDAAGRARDVHIARSLGMGLDEKAKEAVAKWKFVPGMKDGRPVATQVNIEVYFRLY
jgi:protein TonB